MNRFAVRRAVLGVALLGLMATGAQALDGAVAERQGPGEVLVKWQDANPVDVYVSSQPDAAPGKAKLVAKADRDGVYRADWSGPGRPYFILRDEPRRRRRSRRRAPADARPRLELPRCRRLSGRRTASTCAGG